MSKIGCCNGPISGDGGVRGEEAKEPGSVGVHGEFGGQRRAGRDATQCAVGGAVLCDGRPAGASAH